MSTLKNIWEFLGVSSAAGIAGVVLFFAMLFGLNRLPKKKYSFAVRVLMGTGAGTVFGLVLSALSGVLNMNSWLRLVAHGYVCLFASVVIPMIFLASVRLVLRTPAEKKVSKLTKWKKWVNTLMMVISATVAVVMGIVFRIGAMPGSDMVVFDSNAGMTLTDQIRTLIPSGLGVDLIATNVVGVFVFGIYVGIAARRMSGKYMDTVKPVFDLVEAAFSVGTSVCKTIIAYKPMGAAAIMAMLTAEHGVAVVLMILKMLVVLTAGAAIMLVIQLIFCALSGVGPAAFLHAGRGAMIKALKTRSGSDCLPDAQKALAEGLGLNREITDVVSAYAISSGMQGCGALFPATAAVFAAGICGITLTPATAVVLVLVIMLMSYGITDIPGTATVGEFAAVMGCGIQSALPGLGAMIAIDPIGDVPRTLINVTGCMTNAIIVERRVRK